MTPPDPLRGRALDREIVRLALPALGALVAEPLFLLADAAIVGHLGAAPLAGLAVAGTVLGTLVSLCIFLAYGTTAAVARLAGAGDLAGAARTGVDGLWLAVGLGAALGALGWTAAPMLIDVLGAPADAAPFGVTYLRVSCAGIPAMLVVLAATGALRGLLDVRTPLVVAGAGAAANVALNYVLVYPVGLGIAGSALGTVLAQVGMAVALATVLVRAARRHGAPLRPDAAGIRASAAASWPLLLRTAALRVYPVVAVVWAAAGGTAALAAPAVATTVWTFLALALDAVAIAGQPLVGRGLGAGDVGAVRATSRRLVWWGLWAGVATSALVVVALPWAPALFSPDPDVRAALTGVLVLIAAFQVAAGVLFTLDGILIGAGDHRFLAWSTVGAVVGFLLVGSALAATGAALAAAWWAIGALTACRLIALGVRVRGHAWLVTGTGPPR